MPDGTVRWEDVTTWVGVAKFQPPEATQVPYHASAVQESLRVDNNNQLEVTDQYREQLSLWFESVYEQ